MRIRSRLAVLALCCVAALSPTACAPEVSGPASPIAGNLPAGDMLYQVNYFSPLICAPVGTKVRVDVSGNEHPAATKLMTDGDFGLAGVVYLQVGGDSTTLTTTTNCWSVFIAHADFAGLHGDDLDYVITWPV